MIAESVHPAREPTPLGARIHHALHAAWTVVCLTLLFGLIATRWLRYTRWSALPAFDGVFRELMVLDVQAFVWPWVYDTLKLPILLIALAVLVVGFHRRLPAQLVTRGGGVWRLTPVATSALLGAMLWLHYLFDINPTVALACGSSLVLLMAIERPRLGARLPGSLVLVAMGCCLGGWIFAAWDWVDRTVVVAWGIFLLLTWRFLAQRVGRRDLALLRAVAVIPANLLSLVLPLAVPWHGGAPLGDGLAYSFCEVPGRGTVFAAIPVCDSVNARYEDCRDGRIVEYDRNTLREVAARKYFSPDFHGRFEMMVCLDDEVQVAIQASVIRGRAAIQSVLAFPTADPATFNPETGGPGVGNTIAYDRPHEAMFYTAEFSDRVVRYDRRTQETRLIGADVLARRWYQPVLLTPHTGSSALYTHSIHPARNRIYLAEWIQGRYAYAIDLTSLQVVARYDVGGGGALGITVDPERDRLIVSSTWGIEVFDLKTETLIARRHLGLGNRPVLLDAPRDRLYVSSTVEGKLRILDRDTFATIGQIPIGLGTRFPYLSLDGQRVFASSVQAHFVWDANALPDAR